MSRAVLWREDKPLILASKSSARAALLQQTGIPFVVHGADIDERGLEAELSAAGPRDIAQALACAKAHAVAAEHPDQLVLGADQTMALGSRMFHKPANREEALAQLRALGGKEHALHSAVCVGRGAEILFEAVETARLKMRVLSDRFLEAYADVASPALTASVGAYQAEGLGIHLFESIVGDQSTILGLPLLPLLTFLRRNGSLLG